VDLVAAPPSNGYLKEDDLSKAEAYFPLKLYVCMNCFLVQVDEYEKAENIFSDTYAYFSSFSTTWLEHSKVFADAMTRRAALGPDSLVVEVASNDGYLLQYFKERGIPVLGIEPTRGTADVARGKGIETLQEFFSTAVARRLASENVRADLVIGNNVLAHVPAINDFVHGLSVIVKPTGLVSVEFPHLLRLVEGCQFDTIYHEHFSYLSLIFVQRLFAENGLRVIDVEELTTHGGSLRVIAVRSESRDFEASARVQKVLADERTSGLTQSSYYEGFQDRVDTIKNDFLRFLIDQKAKGEVVAGYGAAAKGNTLLNYCGVKPDLIKFVVDRSPHKQGHYLPGSHIPVVSEDRIREEKPHFIVIFPWNLKSEIMRQLAYVRDWGAKFVFAVPRLEIE
jgi:2-polyprenyl-3-methyl-5-hydroxy-6-metoxy-1,4-benzoquinol methylase